MKIALPKLRSGLSLAALVAVFAMSSASIAAPFVIKYTGTVNAGSTFPEFRVGSRYTVTLVVDNGGASAASQVWTGADLRCVAYSGGSATFAQNLLAQPATTAAGSMTTDAGGVLTANFTAVNGQPTAGTADGVGFNPPLADPVLWFNNNANDVFFDNTRTFGDAAGGVQMAIASWSNPAPFSGPCTAAALGNANAKVPTLSQWAMVILACLMALGALMGMRRRSRP